MSGFVIDHDHQIVPHGADLMHLYDKQGNVLVTAERDGETWNVKAASTDETRHANRAEAIEAMWKDHAYNHLGPINDQGHGYSTLIPHGLAEQP
jgi:hypothetical protein